tara:strand:- start:89 stop:934 length:846 start_codon:yes stop_codon:yes gene_type:complete
MSSTKEKLLDLDINKRIISYFHFMLQEIKTVLYNIDDHLTDECSMNDYQSNIGHNLSFQELLQKNLNTYQQVESVEQYILQENESSTSNYSHTWQILFNRGINYDNEETYLNPVRDELENSLLLWKQIFHYYKSMWIGSNVINYSENGMISMDDSLQIGDNKKGVLNIMNEHTRSHFFISFLLMLQTLRKLHNEFSTVTRSFNLRNSIFTDLNILLTNTNDSFSLVVQYGDIAKEEFHEILRMKKFLLDDKISLNFQTTIDKLCAELDALQLYFDMILESI